MNSIKIFAEVCLSRLEVLSLLFAVLADSVYNPQ
jgi:hypothetical protein